MAFITGALERLCCNCRAFTLSGEATEDPGTNPTSLQRAKRQSCAVVSTMSTRGQQSPRVRAWKATWLRAGAQGARVRGPQNSAGRTGPRAWVAAAREAVSVSRRARERPHLPAAVTLVCPPVQLSSSLLSWARRGDCRVPNLPALPNQLPPRLRGPQGFCVSLCVSGSAHRHSWCLCAVHFC